MRWGSLAVVVVLVLSSGCFGPCRQYYDVEWQDASLAEGLKAGGRAGVVIEPVEERPALPMTPDLPGLAGGTAWRMNYIAYGVGYGASIDMASGGPSFSLTITMTMDAATAREAVRRMAADVTKASSADVDRFTRTLIPDGWSNPEGREVHRSAPLPGPWSLDAPLGANASASEVHWNSAWLYTDTWDYEVQFPTWWVRVGDEGLATFNLTGWFESGPVRGPESPLDAAGEAEVVQKVADQFAKANLPAPTFMDPQVDSSHNSCAF